MTRPHQLETTLRTLRLSGMLDTLDARLAQAQAGELGHLEFLQTLCEDEIARRDATAITRRSAKPASSSPPPSRTSTSTFNPKIPAAHIRDLATLRFIDSRRIRDPARSGRRRQDP